MPTFTLRSPMPVSAEALFAWHARPAGFLRLLPPWENVRLAAVVGPFADGQRVTIRSPILGPLKLDWLAEVHDVIPGREFQDRELAGPFAAWNHTHRMIPDGPSTSFLEDHIDYRLPLGFPGRMLGAGMVRQRLAAMFAYRHAVTASDLRRHGSHSPMTVGITGSRGLVGNELAYFLGAGGHRVVRFARGKADPSAIDDGTTSIGWNPEKPVDPASIDGLDAVVHLAGESIASGRWSKKRKAAILESRVGPTRRLAEAIAAAPRKPRVLVSASAIGIYGDRADDLVDESTPSGSGFLADVCQAWEDATAPARAAGVRVVHLRTGIVLSPRGGALAAQLPAFRAGGGAVLGSGRQWVSWITVHDLLGAIHHALVTPSIEGAINAVAPTPVTNREFGRVLASVLHRPYLMTLPTPALRLMFGEVAGAMVESTRVVPGKLVATGFTFDHPELTGALRFLLGKA